MSKRAWFWTVFLLVEVIAFRHAWLWLPHQRYEALISQPALTTALTNGDETQLAVLARKLHYDYEIFRGSTMAYASDPQLPGIHIFRQPAVGQDVIVPSLHDQLANTQPYQGQLASHRYIFFAVTPPKAARNVTYVIYRKVL